MEYISHGQTAQCNPHNVASCSVNLHSYSNIPNPREILIPQSTIMQDKTFEFSILSHLCPCLGLTWLTAPGNFTSYWAS